MPSEKHFKNFDSEKVARFEEADIVKLLDNAGIVRSRAKIEATIGGARARLAMRDAGEDFSTFVWDAARSLQRPRYPRKSRRP
jgi:DNA-3-methyladenine glycosylase I